MSETQPQDPDCLFCKIVAGQIPCHKVYENEQVLAFLDIGPVSRGHTLVIPKAPYATLDQMPGELAGACMAVVPALAKAIMAATETEHFNVLQNNGRVAHQMVDHVHLHIIPKSADAGLGIHWPAGELEDAATLREKIAAGM